MTDRYLNSKNQAVRHSSNCFSLYCIIFLSTLTAQVKHILNNILNNFFVYH